jgi:signal transduction histidine kinase/ligand-binding sensor domain-containing protein
MSTVEMSLPTIARLHFRVPPPHRTAFVQVYQRELLAQLQERGLRPAQETFTSPLEDVFARLFHVGNPQELKAIVSQLAADETWQESLRALGAMCGNANSDGLLPYALDIYGAPLGPGCDMGVVRGMGTWRTYGAAEGLVSGFVRSIVQAENGHLWFATYGGGLGHFDGREISTYTTREGLAHNETWVVLADADGTLWVGTEGGLSHFDGESFTNYTTEDGLVHDEISAIIRDKEGFLWVGTEGGLSRYDGTHFKNYRTGDGLVDDRVSALLEDAEGFLWVGTEGGLSRFNGDIFTDFTTREGLPDNWVRAIYQDRDGVLWFGCNKGGVSRYDGRRFKTLTEADGLANDGVLSIYQDEEGLLWFGTFRGVSRYDGKTFTNYTERDGLANNRVWSILEDREGHLWFGTFSGVSRYDTRTFSSFRVEQQVVDNGVLAMVRNDEGELFFGPWGGGLAHRRGDEISIYGTDDGFAHEVVLDALKDRVGGLWFCCWQSGISYLHNGYLRHFTHIDGLANDQIWSLSEDSQGRIWFATYTGASCYENGSFRSFTTADGLIHNRLRDIREDSQGRIWFATHGGLSCYENGQFTSYTMADGLVDDSVWCICEDRRGRLWFGSSGGGVSCYDGRRFENFTRADGLASDNVWTIYEDGRGHLWFGSSGGGVSCYDGNVFQIMTQADGLTGNMVQVIREDEDGVLWFGTNNGLTRYQPPPAFPPPVAIDAVVAGRRYESGETVEVQHRSGLVAFEFHGRSFKTRPLAMVYRYRLRGLHEDWRSIRRQRVEYEDLPTGEYVFEVVAVDRDLVYSPQPAVRALQVVPDARDEQIDELEREVRQRTRQLVQAEKMAALGNLVAGIAHELNNPVGAISGAHDVLDRLIERIAKILGPNESEDLQKLLRLLRDNNRNAIGASQRIAQVVRSLKNFSRLDEASYQKADVREGLDSTLTLLTSKFEGRIEVTRAYAEVPAIYCYAAELNQVFMNVLANAAQHIDGSGRIHIETKADAERVYVRISDTGKGIPAANLERIFDPGFTTQGVGVGTGLGLSISYNIMQKHGGRIGVESEVGKGSTFTLELPRREGSRAG